MNIHTKLENHSDLSILRLFILYFANLEEQVAIRASNMQKGIPKDARELCVEI